MADGTFQYVYEVEPSKKGGDNYTLLSASDLSGSRSAQLIDRPQGRSDDLSKLDRNDKFFEFTADGQLREYKYVGTAPDGGGFIAKDGGKAYLFTNTPQTAAGTEYTVNKIDVTHICFMTGTGIATPLGRVPVQDLKIGDLVCTAEGRAVPVRWVGRQSVSRLFADPVRALPICIKAGALADSVPSRDLYVSPCHALLVDDILVQAGALVNGASIVRHENAPLLFTYYHIETDDHSLILAENTPAETFIDNVNRMAFDNWDEHEQLYPNGCALIELPYPRAKGLRQVPRAIRSRLAGRAAMLMAASAAKAA
jgi:hypothetical protein